MRKGSFLVFAIVFLLTTYLIRHFGFKALVVSDQVSQNEKSSVVKTGMITSEGPGWSKEFQPFKIPDSIALEVHISGLKGTMGDSTEVYIEPVELAKKENIKSPMFIPK